jgi:ABC-type Fe3+/spermidine/putrescine transport system ATPase subunit
MRDGEILQEDSPEKIYRYPKSVFVGNFLGGLNILEGYIRHVISNDEYEVKIRLGGPKYPVINTFEKFYLDETVILSFRFEDLYLFKKNYDYEGSEADWKGIILSSAKIIDQFLTGKEKMYIIEMDNGDIVRARKPETFQYEFGIEEEMLIGLFPQDINLMKYPHNLQKEMELQ